MLRGSLYLRVLILHRCPVVVAGAFSAAEMRPSASAAWPARPRTGALRSCSCEAAPANSSKQRRPRHRNSTSDLRTVPGRQGAFGGRQYLSCSVVLSGAAARGGHVIVVGWPTFIWGGGLRWRSKSYFGWLAMWKCFFSRHLIQDKRMGLFGKEAGLGKKRGLLCVCRCMVKDPIVLLRWCCLGDEQRIGMLA